MIQPLKTLYSYYVALKCSARMCRILLADHRYFDSVRRGEILDRAGQPIPWFTYCAIEALGNWDLSGKRVFEYGSGYSTLYWAARAKEVVSVEHHPEWHAKISARLPANARIILATITRTPGRHPLSPREREEFRQYAESVLECGVFDLVVLDGYAGAGLRHQCAHAALHRLASTGMVILDNADWLPATALYLRRAGLIEVDLSGPAPGTAQCQTTSFFFTRAFDFTSTASRQPLPPVGGHPVNWEATLERELLGRPQAEGNASEAASERALLPSRHQRPGRGAGQR